MKTLANPTLLLVTLILYLGVFTSCAEEADETVTQVPFVNPPVPEWDPVYSTLEFQAEEGEIYRHPSGSTVIIPPACLVDQEGKSVTGTVELRYREFHDALDILLSGIPMAYDSAGRREHLETAGMFEVRVYQGGQELVVGEGSLLQVNLASSQAEDNFNFYRLDEAGRNWQFSGTRSPEVNFEKVARREKIRSLSQKRPFPLDKNHFCFNYDGLLDVYLREDWQAIEQGRRDSLMKGKVLSKAATYGLRCLDFSVWAQVEWRGSLHPVNMVVWKNLKKKDFPDWASHFERAKFEDLGNETHRIELYGREEGQYFETVARFVMPLKSLFAFSPEYWENQYETAMEEVAREQERMKTEAEVFRSFEISQLGIYNWDRLRKVEEFLPLAADFRFDSLGLNSRLSDPMVYYLPGNERSVIKFPRSDWRNFALTRDPGACMLSILPGNRVALYPPEAFAAIDRQAIRKMPEPAYTFDMKVRGEPLVSAAELRDFLKM